MTALILFALLVFGIATYADVAAHAVARGASIWWYIAGVPVAYLLPAVLLTAVWFSMAWIWRTPRPPEARLSLPAAIRLYADELFAVATSWPLVALHRLLVRDPVPRPSAQPVLLVHGVLINDGIWLRLRSHLERAGLGPVYTVNYGPPLADIEDFAVQLANKIDAVCAATGATQVALVAHSMGGLVSRAYLRRFGPARVSQLITVGTPHHGSMLAYMFPGRCLAQMRPGNAWLAELNQAEAEASGVPIATIWSRHDSMVAPQASAALAGAQDVALIGIGHNALLHSAEVERHVSRLLSHRARAGAPS